jgi:proliferating cell nuclear antigen
LARILKCAGNDDRITLRAEEDGNVIQLTFEAPNNAQSSEFELNMMEIETEHLTIPATEYKCSVEMSSNEFQRIMRDMGTLGGDTITVAVSKEGVRFSVKGEVGTGSILRKPNVVEGKPAESTIIEVDEPVELAFAVRYLNQFTKATPLSETVKLNLSEQVPLLVQYRVEDMGSISYYLAPKVE